MFNQFLFPTIDLMSKHLLLCLLASYSAAVISSEVRVETPITYHPLADVDKTVKVECKVEELLERHLTEGLQRWAKNMARHRPAPPTTEEGSEKLPETPEQTVRLQITHVLGIGGGAWTGPKAITVQATLLEQDKVIREAKINRWSVGGVFGSLKGTCTILERCAKQIGIQLGRWAHDPHYAIKEVRRPRDPKPDETAVEQAPAADDAQKD